MGEGKGAMAKVLIIEDDPGVRAVYSAAVRHGGHDVVCASDGREALGVLERWRPQVILLDLIMPVMDGLALLRILRTQRVGIPVIVCTAMTEGRIVDEARSLGAAEVLTKGSFTAKELLATIASYVAHASAAVAPAGAPA